MNADMNATEDAMWLDAKLVREWRFSLQRALLGRQPPKNEEMPGIDALFTTIEQHGRMSIVSLQFSKIGKIMRYITALPPDKLPRDAEFNFKGRANVLIEIWFQILNTNKRNAAADDGTIGESVKQGEYPETATMRTDSSDIITSEHQPEAAPVQAAAGDSDSAMPSNLEDYDDEDNAEYPDEGLPGPLCIPVELKPYEDGVEFDRSQQKSRRDLLEEFDRSQQQSRQDFVCALQTLLEPVANDMQ